MKYLLLATLFFSQMSFAQDPGTDAACFKAQQKFCKDKKIPSEIRFCLMEKRTAVDEACADVISANQKKYQKAIDLCRQQIWKICDKNFKGNVQGCFRVERDMFKGECGAAVRALK